MRLLVIGGTVFVGRAVVAAALARGHDVTVFHRGRHGEDAHPGVEHVHGDRATDLGLVSGREWDAVVDTCGFDGAALRASAEALRDVPHYSFVSSVSVYAGWPAEPVTEASPVYGDDAPAEYGADKARAERAVVGALGADRVLVSRPGLIVGPHENIGRLPFWLRRIARGGDVLAPGRPGDERQWIDARDLAGWLVRCAEERTAGTYNAVCEPGAFTMGELLDACVEVTGSGATLRWTDERAIAESGIAPWTELPIWLWDPAGGTSGTWQVRTAAPGLTTRPMAETVRDTWEWLRRGGADEGYRGEYAVRDLDPEREAAGLGFAP
jgi:2'-hydroxyisoflavone reductase